MIMNKIERLASKPLMTKEDVEVKTKHLSETTKKNPDSKNVIKFNTKFAAETGNLETVRKEQLIDKFHNSFQIFQDLENDLKPVSEQDFIETYAAHKQVDFETAVKVANELFHALDEIGMPLTRFVMLQCLDDEEFKKFDSYIVSQESLV